jgi:hypothetical protein
MFAGVKAEAQVTTDIGSQYCKAELQLIPKKHFKVN